MIYLFHFFLSFLSCSRLTAGKKYFNIIKIQNSRATKSFKEAFNMLCVTQKSLLSRLKNKMRYKNSEELHKMISFSGSADLTLTHRRPQAVASWVSCPTFDFGLQPIFYTYVHVTKKRKKYIDMYEIILLLY